MIALALEMSSRQGSVALLADGAVKAERVWMDEGARSRTIFQVYKDLLQDEGLKPRDVGAYVVGRGPGSYTGLRVAVTAAQGLALPRGDTIYCLSSGLALAAELLAIHATDRVAIVGDARRGQLWMGLYKRGAAEDDVLEESAWILVQPGELPNRLPPGTLVASPDRTKMAESFRGLTRPDIRWLEQDGYPRAAWLGRIGWRRLQNGIPSEPATPIYLHAAVMARG